MKGFLHFHILIALEIATSILYPIIEVIWSLLVALVQKQMEKAMLNNSTYNIYWNMKETYVIKIDWFYPIRLFYFACGHLKKDWIHIDMELITILLKQLWINF